MSDNNRYEVRPWNTGSQSFEIRFQKAPGRGEGEPIFAVYFDAASSWADYTQSDEYGEAGTDVFRSPFNLDTLPEVESLPKLTTSEEECLAQYAGAALSWDGMGFIYLDMLLTNSDVDKRIAELIQIDNEQSESEIPG